MELFWSSGWSLGIGIALGSALAGMVVLALRWQQRAETVLEQPVPDGVDTALEVIGATGIVLDADNRVLRAWLMDLSEQVGRRLRAHQRFGRTVQLKVRFEDFHTITRSHTLPQATQSTRQIWQAAQSLLAAARQSDPRPVRLIGVGISSLGEGSVTASLQQDMFAPMQQPLDSAKQQQIDKLADNIQLRFGKSAIKRATGIRRRDR